MFNELEANNGGVLYFRLPWDEQRTWHGSEACAGQKYECTCSFMLFATTKFKTIVVKEMEPNFVRRKVLELKKYLQVRRITFANKCRKERLDLSVKSHELPIEIRDDPGDWMGFSAMMVTDD